MSVEGSTLTKRLIGGSQAGIERALDRDAATEAVEIAGEAVAAASPKSFAGDSSGAPSGPRASASKATVSPLSRSTIGW